MMDRFKQMMEFKKQADQIKRELEQTRIDVNDVRGIKITVNGTQQFQTIEISEELLSASNKKTLEGELLRAVNSAVGRSQAAGAQKMKDVMGANAPGF